MTTNSQLLTVREAAKLLSVSQLTIRRMISDGRLPSVRIGRLVRIPYRTIEEMTNGTSSES